MELVVDCRGFRFTEDLVDKWRDYFLDLENTRPWTGKSAIWSLAGYSKDSHINLQHVSIPTSLTSDTAEPAGRVRLPSMCTGFVKV